MEGRKSPRPDNWTATINDNFAKLSNATNTGYTERGKTDYGFPLMDQKDIYNKIAALSAGNNKRINVLDIGTGNGEYIYNLAAKFPDKVNAVGITAVNMREIEKKNKLDAAEKSWTHDTEAIKNSRDIRLTEDVKAMLISDRKEMYETAKANIERNFKDHPNAKYAVHNCENLFASNQSLKNEFSLKPEKFDLVVSSTTFMHLTDPAGGLQQAYQALKVGGELIIDRFTLNGLVDNDQRPESKVNYHKALVQSLKESGYTVEATYDKAGQAIACLHMVKTANKPTLELPLEYTNTPGVYAPNQKLKDTYSKSSQKENVAGKNTTSQMNLAFAGDNATVALKKIKQAPAATTPPAATQPAATQPAATTAASTASHDPKETQNTESTKPRIT